MRLLSLQTPLSVPEQTEIAVMLSSPAMQRLVSTVKGNIATLSAEAVNYGLKDGPGADHTANVMERIRKAQEFDTFLKVLDKFKSGDYQFTTVILQPE